MNCQQVIKRCADLFIAFTALALLFPVLVLTALIIVLDDGFPVCYLSYRLVSVNKSIKIFKFRSMVKDAKSSKYNLNERFMNNGYLDIPLSCEAYTRVGRWLERLQIVETLQFLNIILNGMSLIGNRPLPKENISLLRSHKGWEDRFLSPAGITGIAQVVGKLNMRPDQRLALEVLYSKVYDQGNILKCDFLIAIHTVRLILLSKPLEYKDANHILNTCLR